MRTTLRASLFVLVAFLCGCSEPKPEVVQAETHLAAIRAAGLVSDGLKSVEIGEVRRIRPDASGGDIGHHFDSCEAGAGGLFGPRVWGQTIPSCC